MIGNIDRMFMKETYDVLDIYHDFKNQEDFLKKRKEWIELDLGTKRMMMVVANIQNASQRVYSWQTIQQINIKTFEKNTHAFYFSGKQTSHGRYQTIINAFNSGEKSIYIHMDEKRSKETYGVVKNSFLMYVIDYIEKYEKMMKHVLVNKEIIPYPHTFSPDIPTIV